MAIQNELRAFERASGRVLSTRKIWLGMATAGLISASGAVHAIQFELGPIEGSIESLLTAGATWRIQDRADYLVGKSNLEPGICIQRDPDGSLGGGRVGDESSCSSTDFGENLEYVNARGSFSQNSDGGNLSFDKGDVVAAAVKLNSEISFDVPVPVLGSLAVYANPIYLYDSEVLNSPNYHPDTTLQPAETPRAGAVDDVAGSNFDWASYHVSGYIPFFGGRDILVRVGRQGLNWGESSALVFNSLNAINPPHGVRARLPGFQLEEAFQAVGMAIINTDITSNLFLEAFYQYEWKPAIADPVGTFYSVSDTVGAGGTYAMLSFAKQPEDPEQIYASANNEDDPLFILGSQSSRTVLRVGDQRPDDEGQYGFALRYFAEWLNNGTELAAYFANYHARIPTVSAYAADPTCIDSSLQGPAALAPCLASPDQPVPDVAAVVAGLQAGQLTPAQEPLPVDTMQLFVEYPEDIKMYGVSFNTTVGDWAVSGEYSFRENLPIQVHSTDLVYAGLQPAFPENDVEVIPGTVLPGRRSAVPDFVNTLYRDNPVDADGTRNGVENYYIRGWEREQVHQLQFTFINTWGGANWFDASQILTVAEIGGTYLPNMPEYSELQYNGAEVNTHASVGADNTTNGFDSGSLGAACQGLDNPNSCRQNPTSQALDHFPTDFSWGVRVLSIFRYQNALLGANLEPIVGFFWDVNGIAPGLGQNFIEGNKTLITALRFDYLNKWVGEVRLTTFTGGSDYNSRRDRDNVYVYLGYNF